MEGVCLMGEEQCGLPTVTEVEDDRGWNRFLDQGQKLFPGDKAHGRDRAKRRIEICGFWKLVSRGGEWNRISAAVRVWMMTIVPPHLGTATKRTGWAARRGLEEFLSTSLAGLEAAFIDDSNNQTLRSKLLAPTQTKLVRARPMGCAQKSLPGPTAVRLNLRWGRNAGRRDVHVSPKGARQLERNRLSPRARNLPAKTAVIAAARGRRRGLQDDASYSTPDVCVEDARFNPPATLDLNKQPIVAGLRESIGKRHFGGERLF